MSEETKARETVEIEAAFLARMEFAVSKALEVLEAIGHAAEVAHDHAGDVRTDQGMFSVIKAAAETGDRHLWPVSERLSDLVSLEKRQIAAREAEREADELPDWARKVAEGAK